VFKTRPEVRLPNLDQEQLATAPPRVQISAFTTTAMFKGILPSKRVASSTDFTMITPLGDSNTNIDSHQPSSKGKPALSSKGFPSNTDKRHQRSESKWLKKNQTLKEDEEPELQDTNLAFDQLLVRFHVNECGAALNSCFRMNFRFRRL
jgi:hypothetical protein